VSTKKDRLNYAKVTARSTVDYASVTSMIHCRVRGVTFLFPGVINKLQSIGYEG